MAVDIRFLQNLPPEVIQQNDDLRTLGRIDADHNGEITSEEAGQFLSQPGPDAPLPPNPPALRRATLLYMYQLERTAAPFRQAVEQGRVSLAPFRSLNPAGTQSFHTDRLFDLDQNYSNALDLSEIQNGILEERSPLIRVLRGTADDLHQTELNHQNDTLQGIFHYVSYIPRHIIQPVMGGEGLTGIGHGIGTMVDYMRGRGDSLNPNAASPYSWRGGIAYVADHRHLRRLEAIEHFEQIRSEYPNEELYDLLGHMRDRGQSEDVEILDRDLRIYESDDTVNAGDSAHRGRRAVSLLQNQSDLLWNRLANPPNAPLNFEIRPLPETGFQLFTTPQLAENNQFTIILDASQTPEGNETLNRIDTYERLRSHWVARPGEDLNTILGQMDRWENPQTVQQLRNDPFILNLEQNVRDRLPHDRGMAAVHLTNVLREGDWNVSIAGDRFAMGSFSEFMATPWRNNNYISARSILTYLSTPSNSLPEEVRQVAAANLSDSLGNGRGLMSNLLPWHWGEDWSDEAGSFNTIWSESVSLGIELIATRGLFRALRWGGAAIWGVTGGRVTAYIASQGGWGVWGARVFLGYDMIAAQQAVSQGLFQQILASSLTTEGIALAEQGTLASGTTVLGETALSGAGESTLAIGTTTAVNATSQVAAANSPGLIRTVAGTLWRGLTAPPRTLGHGLQWSARQIMGRQYGTISSTMITGTFASTVTAEQHLMRPPGMDVNYDDIDYSYQLDSPQTPQDPQAPLTSDALRTLALRRLLQAQTQSNEIQRATDSLNIGFLEMLPPAFVQDRPFLSNLRSMDTDGDHLLSSEETAEFIVNQNFDTIDNVEGLSRLNDAYRETLREELGNLTTVIQRRRVSLSPLNRLSTARREATHADSLHDLDTDHSGSITLMEMGSALTSQTTEGDLNTLALINLVNIQLQINEELRSVR